MTDSTSEIGPANATDSRKRRRGRNTGKLSRMIEMPLDIVYEIAGKLRPLDLLQLSRVSKQFRQTFASKDSRVLWVDVRRNVLNLPDPPPHISEPKYASLIFEFSCFDCGTGRSSKVNHAFCVRFCGKCWKAHVKSGRWLLSKYEVAEQSMLQLIPREDQTYSPNFILNKTAETTALYHAVQFATVLEEYSQLTASERPAYVAERKRIVAGLHKHANEMREWERRTRMAQIREEHRAQESRQSNINARLLEIGYVQDDFPPFYHPRWMPLVGQPRELTERIWKSIKPKLVKAIEVYRVEVAEQAREDRAAQRRDELSELYKSWLATQPLSLGLVPSCQTLCCVGAIDALLSRDDFFTPFTQGDFETIVLPEVQKITKDNNWILVTGCRRRWNVGNDQRLAVDELARHFSAALTVKPEPTPPDLERDIDAEEMVHTDLGRATAIFFCSRCIGTPRGEPLSFLELCAHHRRHHFRGGRHHLRDGERDLHYYPFPDGPEIAKRVLTTLHLKEDTPYDQLGAGKTYQVICTCGKPGMQQPMAFSKLIGHLHEEAQWEELFSVHDHATVNFPRLLQLQLA